MARLREIASSAGLDRVRTYIQSGNLVFVAPRGAADAEVAAALRSAIVAATALDPEVIVRTRADLARVVQVDPYIARGDDPAHLHVLFLGEPAGPRLAEFDAAGHAPEEVVAIGRELHLRLPGGVGRSRLATDLSRRLGPSGTMRSWRTVTTLLDLAADTA